MSRQPPRSLWIGILLALVLAALLLASIGHVPSGSVALTIRADHPAGELRTAGFHVVGPFATLVNFPAGPYRHRGVARVVSPEGATMAVPYDAEFVFADARPAVLEGVARRILAGHSLNRSVDGALVRPGGAPGPPIDALEGRLESLGLVPGSLKPGQPRIVSGEVGPLREAWGGGPRPVLLIGVDSADWDLMEPLIRDGALPATAALRTRGAWGTLQSMSPTLSPILWTTIATGRPPEEHGILDFLMKDPTSGAEVPISRLFRRVKALWNIGTDLDLRTMTVGWWATWPAEPVNGFMVTDRVAYTLFDLPLEEDQPGLAYPPGLLERMGATRTDEEDITYEEVRAIIPISRERFEAARETLGSSGSWQDPVAHLIRVLAGTLTYHRTALSLVRDEAPDLGLIYYEGLDEVNHRFAHYMPPVMSMVEGVDGSEREAFSVAVANFYRFQDRLIGELVEAAGPEAVVFLVSDHGFANGNERPVDVPPDIEGKPGLWHRMEGVVILAGPPVRPGRLDDAGLLDIVPTILAIMGLPAPSDMQGRALTGALDPRRLPSPPDVVVASYDAVGEPLHATGVAATTEQDQEVIARLRALGYIDAGTPAGGGDAGPGTATSHINAGHIFLRKGEFERAEKEFLRAREIAPRFDQAHLGLAQVAVDRGRPADALAHLKAALTVAPPQPALLTRAARVFSRADQRSEGIAFLDSLSLSGRADAFRRAAVGMLREGEKDFEGAVRSYREALRVDPSVPAALRGIYFLLRDRAPEEAASLLEASLQAEPHAVAMRSANWLALIRERQGRVDDALATLSTALARDSSDVMTLTNLGSMLVRYDRPGEGLGHLERADEVRPGVHEVQVNLIVAYGRLEDIDAARATFEAARVNALPGELPPLLNAVAWACYLAGEREEALRHLDASLSLKPGQPDAIALRDAVLDRGV